MSTTTARLVRDRPAAAAAADGPNPLLILAAAFAAGFLLARIIDWRSHAHPRR